MGVAASTTGINTIPVMKTELLERLKKNKDKHEGEFKTNLRGYQADWLKKAEKARRALIVAHETLLRRFDKAVAAAQKAHDREELATFPVHFAGMPVTFDAPPACHTKDYELAIDLFEMFQPMDKERPGVIDLSPSDFANYCRDDWQWKQIHLTSLDRYSGPAGPAGPAGPHGRPGGFALHELRIENDDNGDQD